MPKESSPIQNQSASNPQASGGANTDTSNPLMQALREGIRKEEELKRKAYAGDPIAQCALAKQLYATDQLAKVREAVSLWARAAQQNFSEAFLQLGLIAVRSGDFRWVSLLSKAAQLNNVAAQYILGSKYKNGGEVPRNIAKAIELYTSAANQGYARAQCALGRMYQNGIGLPRNIDKAIELYTQAAKQGYVDAQYTLGVLYEEGYLTQAIKWHKIAAEHNDVRAQYALGKIYERMSNYKLAMQYYMQAASQEHAQAQKCCMRLQAKLNATPRLPPQISLAKILLKHSFRQRPPVQKRNGASSLARVVEIKVDENEVNQTNMQ